MYIEQGEITVLLKAIRKQITSFEKERKVYYRKGYFYIIDPVSCKFKKSKNNQWKNYEKFYLLEEKLRLANKQ